MKHPTNHGNDWTEQEIEFVNQNWDTMKYREIAEKLGRTREAIRSAVRKLGFTKDTSLPVNHRFFKEWNRQVAWLLGFWCADGNASMIGGLHIINFAQSNLAFMEKVKRLLESEHKIVKGKGYMLTFSSNEMYADMCNLMGCELERKSLTLQWPIALPDDLARDFIRGLVDGDGSLRFRKEKPIIDFCSGSRSLAESFMEAVARLTGISVNLSLHPNGTTSYWRVSGLKAQCFAKWLYSDCDDLCLERKRRIAFEISEWKPYAYRRSSTTPKMRALFGLP